MKKANISIIIPAYNAEKTITRCIKSVQAQLYTDYEVIVIDDGSEDKTADMVAQICSEDDRIHLYSQSNHGVSNARNTALSYAAGKYIMFVDSDDLIQPQYMQTYFDAAERENADIVIGGCERHDLETSEIEEIVPKVIGDITQDVWGQIAIDSSIYGYNWSKIIKRDLIENNNIRFNENMYSQEDLNFNLDVYDKANKIITIADTGYIYEYRKSNRTPDLTGYINNQLKLLNICFKKAALTEEIETKIQKRLESYCFGFLMHSDNRKKDIAKLHQIDGLDEALKSIKINDEKSYVCWMLAHSYDGMVRIHFYCRDRAKRMLGRGNK